MPAVIPASLGLIAGLTAGLLLVFAPWVMAPAGAALALLAWRRAGPVAAFTAAMAAGAVVGGTTRRIHLGDCPALWRDGVRVALVAEPLDLPSLGARDFRIRTPVQCAGPIHVVLPEGDTSSGVRVVVGTWRRDPGRGAVAALRPERAGVVLVRRTRTIAARPGWRSRLQLAAEQRLVRLFGPARAPLAIALTVSADAPTPESVRTPFRRSGLAHILSISGFHVAILAGALVLLLRLLRLGPDAARLAATPLVAAYVWMLGFPAPALRAAFLLGLWAWARLRQRPPDGAALVASAALGLGLADPRAVLDPGPWLSFAGAYGCMAASRWVRAVAREQREGIRRWLPRIEPLAVSLGALLATTPVTIVAFGNITPAALVANLAAVPAAAFAIPALALALGLSIAGWRAGAALAAAGAGAGLDVLEKVARAAAAWPWAQLDVSQSVPLAVAAGAVSLLLLLRPTAERRRRAASALCARCALAAACVAALLLAPDLYARAAASDGDGRLAIHFLDVGQGDGALIHTPGGRWIMVDAGPRTPGMDAGRRVMLPFLRRHGVRRLALVVASHGHADHVGGMPAVLAAVPADVVEEPGQVLGIPQYLQFLAEVAHDGLRWHVARAGERLQLDGVTLRVWHPDSAWMARGEEDPNANSVVLTVEYGRFRAVFAGDAGLAMEALHAREIGAVTLLKVGHHGSAGATGDAWLAALRPAVCVVSVGPNKYGHPSPAALQRMDDAGCGVWRTDRDGDITVSSDGRSAVVEAGKRRAMLTLSGEGP